MTNLIELETPCLLLDKTKLTNNLSVMRNHLAQLGVPLRPHGKSAKCIEVMRLVLENQPGGIAVSTLKEAEYYFKHGIGDLLYTVGIVPGKLDRIARLVAAGGNVTVLVDSLEQAQLVAPKAQALGLALPVLIEIDCDGHRSGIVPGDSELLQVARYLDDSPGVILQGVLTHAGDSYGCTSQQEIEYHGAREREQIVRCAQLLTDNSLPCPTVSLGSTPTARYARDLAGVTEIRAGVFMFYDLFMAGLGVCRVGDVALSVLSSVIGYQKEKGWIIVDAGWMAMSRDRGTASQKIDQGYGVVCDMEGHPIGDLIVSAANQEHGIIASRAGQAINWSQFPVGTTLRILPNHACATCAQHDRYHVLEGVDVTEVWPRINGWAPESELLASAIGR